MMGSKRDLGRSSWITMGKIVLFGNFKMGPALCPIDLRSTPLILHDFKSEIDTALNGGWGHQKGILTEGGLVTGIIITVNIQEAGANVVHAYLQNRNFFQVEFFKSEVGFFFCNQNFTVSS